MFELRKHQEETINLMKEHTKGKILIPTGGGKTICMIYDAMNLFKSNTPKNIVIVSPRIGLSIQLRNEFLEHIDCASVMHVHTNVVKKSDKTQDHFYTSTDINKISMWNEHVDGHKMYFTTYHSLKRLEDASINVDTIYFDEAHNSVRKDFYANIEHFSTVSERSFFFTATPKNSINPNKPGMNWSETYGNTIMNVSAPSLLESGSIIAPKLIPVRTNITRIKQMDAEYDCMSILDIINNEESMDKVLISSPSTRVLIRMLAETDFMKEVTEMGYEVLWITSKYGAFINNKKVSREVFFKTLSEYGKDEDKKFIILHYSILSEGINCPGLTACIMMRQMNIIQTAQTIGRVTRLHPEDSKRIKNGDLTPGDVDNYVKPFGMIYVPVHTNTGEKTVHCLEKVLETSFRDGKAPEQVVS